MSVVISKFVNKLRVFEMVVLLCLSVLVPFFIHFIPDFSNYPAGMFFVPLFYAPLIAFYFYGKPMALVVALSSPLLNNIITGYPESQKLGLLTIKLIVFVLCLSLLDKFIPKFICPAIAYLLTTVFVLLLLGALELNNFIIALPGFLLIMLISFLMHVYVKDN